MIRILHVVPTLNINSGMMSVVMNYYRNIDRNEIQFDFLYFGYMKDNHGEEIERLGGRLYYMERPTFKPGDQKRLRKFFAEHKGEFTAVHCHPIWSSIVVAREAKHSGIKHIIQHAHSTNYSEKKISALRNRFLMKFIRLFATDFIACNSEAALLFGRKIANSNKMSILPNAINLKCYSYNDNLRKKIREEFDILEDTKLFGNVGRLSVEKNQLHIIETFKCIKDFEPNSKLLLVGDGSLRFEIEQSIKNNHLEDSVILTGKRRDIQAILSALDLFLMPSIFEGTPVSAIEALASGLPCILSDTITKSICIDRVVYLSLSKSHICWAKKAIEMVSFWRNNRTSIDQLRSIGFDISLETKRLEDYYLRLSD